jgi:Tol biopolymer transport system component
MARSMWQWASFLCLVVLGACGTDPEQPEPTIIVFTGVNGLERHIFSMQPDGSQVVQLTSGAVVDDDPAISRDGSRIAFVRRDAAPSLEQIYVMNADGSDLRAVTNGATADFQPAWSPDGQRIVFSTFGGSASDGLHLVNSDGTGRELLVSSGGNSYGLSTWSPNGQVIVFVGTPPPGGPPSVLFRVNADGTGLSQLTSGPAQDIDPSWSPDGQQLAFTTVAEDGTASLAVMNANGSGRRDIIPDISALHPEWSPDGGQLTFWTQEPEGAIWVVNADGTGLQRITAPTLDGMQPDWGFDR